MLRNSFTILIFFILSILNLDAQNVTFFNSKQGLSNSCINSIYEDSRSNVWISTLNGLNRFDGVKLNVYYHDDNNPKSLIHDDVNFVYEYDRDNLFVGTGTGLQLYNYANDTFTDVPIIDQNGDTIRMHFKNMVRLNDNGKERLFACFSGYGNAEVIRESDGTFSLSQVTEFNTDNSQASPLNFLQDKKNRIWLVNSLGHVYLRKGKTLKNYPEISRGVNMCCLESGNVYVATENNGLFVYDEKSDSFHCVASAQDLGATVYAIRSWRFNRIFVCTDGGGLRIYNEADNKVTLSSIKISNFDLATANVKDAFCDKYNNVWVGVYWMGVMMKPHNQSGFEYVGRNSITKNTLGSNSIFTIAKADDSHIWVAPDNDGLYLLKDDGNSSVHYGKDKYPQMPPSITTILPLNQNISNANLLIGSYNDGLWQMQSNALVPITREINHIFDIQPAEEGHVWISTMGDGLYNYNIATHQFKHYPGYDAQRNYLLNPYIYCVLQKGKTLYLGTADGILYVNIKADGTPSQKSTWFLHNHAVKHFTLTPDGKGIWAATNRGLYYIDKETSEIRRYSKNNDLANNSTKAVYLDGKSLWIATDNGLSHLNIETGKFDNYYASDGLQDNEFNRGTVLGLNGNLYFGGISGLSYFKPKDILTLNEKTEQYKLKLVDLRLNGAYQHRGNYSDSYEVLDGVLDDGCEINLSHKERRFIIELCVPGQNNLHTTYEFSIDGSDWVDQGSESNRLIFENLKTGKHKIRLRAKVLDTYSDERELTVIIHPAWYASWWAILIYILLFAGFCYLAYNYMQRQVHVRRVLMRHRQQQEINEARIQFFMNISHEIRTPMTLILAPLEKLMRMDKDPECQRNYSLMKQNANRILRLINQMMDVRKIEQGKFQLDYHKVELVSLIQNAFEVFQTNAQSRKINYEFKHDGISTLPVVVDPENIDKIIINLLSNAFKFTPDEGKITLSLTSDNSGNQSESQSPESFTIKVIDSGVGIPDSDKSKVFDRFYSASQKKGYIGTGIGLNLTSLLTQMHNGTINVSDNPEGQGSMFTVELPVNGSGDDSALSKELETYETVTPSASDVYDDEKQEDNIPTPIVIEAPAPAPVPATSATSAKSTILLVEDDEAIRQYVHSEFATDYNVVDFADGQPAWDYVLSHSDNINLIISDIMMPVMDGLTLCQKLKSNFRTNHIPIILMTALGSDGDRIAGISNGADAYISKPFNIDVLRTTAQGLLLNRQLLQGRFKSEQIQSEQTEQIEIESPDENLMRRVMKVINENMDNEELSVEMIADKVGISRVHFYRKMKDLTGQAPREFVKYVRLKEAARLLSTKKMDITGVSIACGFKSPSSFSTYFKALYGLSPSEWVKQNVNKEKDADSDKKNKD